MRYWYITCVRGIDMRESKPAGADARKDKEVQDVKKKAAEVRALCEATMRTMAAIKARKGLRENTQSTFV